MKKKRSLLISAAALLLTAAVLFGALPLFAAASGPVMTYALFEEKLAAFKENVYPNGSTYVDNIREFRGIQCFGFANEISKYIFGTFATYSGAGKYLYSNNWEINRGSAALNNLHVGDVIRYRSSSSSDHSVFVTGMDDEYVYISDANNDHRNTVRHNAKITWTKLYDRIDRALESDSSYIGYVAHYKYWNDSPSDPTPSVTVSYNANGAATENEITGQRYRVTAPEGLKIRAGAGTDKQHLTSMKYDETFIVPAGAQTAEADGYVWSQVVFGSYEGWSVISESDWCEPTGPVYGGTYYADANGDIRLCSSGNVYTQTAGSKWTMPDAETFGLVYPDMIFKGWSDAADGAAMTADQLRQKYRTGTVVLYAVYEEVPAVPDEPDDPGDPSEPPADSLVIYYNVNGGEVGDIYIGDRYRVTAYDGLIIREAPGTSSKRVITMHYDSVFCVLPGDRVETGGYTWAPVRYEEYEGWSAVSDFCEMTGTVTESRYGKDGEGNLTVLSAGRKLFQIIDEQSSLLNAADTGISREGYEFAGWSETADGAAVTLAEITGKYDKGAVTLYAVWEKLPETGGPDDPGQPEGKTGDADGDGILSNLDVVLLFHYLSSGEGGLDEALMDVDGDGTLSNRDVTALFKMICTQQ
ncbi:MAG: InlB B-repeat-containing protein [Clostridia bacterium]|nr:InlB B-repeat-containing protein [Clostridia bacterium]